MAATSGHGTVFNYHNGSSYAAVGNIVEIEWSGLTREVVDSSAMDDANSFRTYISGRLDAGEISLKVNLVDSETEQEAIRDQILDGATSDALDQYQIQWPSSGSTYSFTGFITDHSFAFSDGDKITADIKIKISGKPTVA